MQWQENETYRRQTQHDSIIMCKDDYHHDIPCIQRYDFGYFNKSSCSSSIYLFEEKNYGKLRDQNDATAHFQLFLIFVFFLQKS